MDLFRDNILFRFCCFVQTKFMFLITDNFHKNNEFKRVYKYKK